MAKILLVEDDNNLREIFELRLQADGYDTVVASNGEEALVIALKEKPDLIIADVMMPKMSGFEMVENLRASPDMANTKVVMMTALGQAEDRARGESLGVVKYLVKSQVTLEDFARVIKEVLSNMSSSTDESLTSNAGDKKMPTDSDVPTATPTTTDNATPSANPISADASTTSSDQPQMSSSDAASAMQKQVDAFASTMNSPAAGSTTADIPVAEPPADPVPPIDPTPPPSPDGPTTT